ncbi:hypothetical protein BDY24DRAFT_187759 [Mrakia frigida]|uniref:uncharacterized protein n=1 Tax=Mrakia frigida TaxID=29902 RepID=UPI003FCC09B5
MSFAPINLSLTPSPNPASYQQQHPISRASTPGHAHSSSTGGGGAGGGSSSGPLELFDHHLQEIGTDYLWFFNERVRLEEQFADSLSLLTQRTQALDRGTDSLGFNNSKHSLPSVRTAWRQVRENTEQEVEARRAFASNLREEVIKPLSALKVSFSFNSGIVSLSPSRRWNADGSSLQATQTRISNRIAEDIKNSHEKYNEQAAALTRLQKNYVRKTSEYVDTISPHSSSSSVSSPPARPAAPIPSLSSTSTIGSSTASPTTQSAADQRREDIARGIGQTKKGLNQFISNLRGDRDKDKDKDKDKDRGGSMDESRERAAGAEERELQREREKERGEREKERERAEAGTMRGVRAKREAEEADAKYRLGVFHLESLRINVERVSQGGSNSAQDFVQELVLTLQSALAKFSIGLQATSMFAFQMGKRSEEAVEKIDLGKDVNASLLALGGSSGGMRERPLKPVPYNNFYVGPCKDLIFGVSLQDYAFARGISGNTNAVPILVEKCIKAIEERGLDAEGLYRISPRLATVQNLIHKIEIDEEKFEFARTEEIYTIAAILKLYLRRLPEPLFRWSLQERVAFTKERDDHIANGFLVLRAKLKRLPPIHVATLKALAEHLSMVVLADNKMDAKNLSIIFSSIIFGENDITDVGVLTMMQMAKDTSFEDLLIYSSVIFAEKDRSPYTKGPDLTLVGEGSSSIVRSRSRSGSLSSALHQQQQQTKESRSRSGSINAASPIVAMSSSSPASPGGSTGYNPVPVVNNDFAPSSSSLGYSGSIHQNLHRRKISLRNEQEALGLATGSSSSPISTTSSSLPPPLPSAPTPPHLPPRTTSTGQAAEGPMLPPPLPNRPQRVTSIGSSRLSKSSSSPPGEEEVVGVEFDAAEEESKLAASLAASQVPPLSSTSLLGLVVPEPSSSSMGDGGAPSPGLVRLVNDADETLTKLEDKAEGEVVVEKAKEDEGEVSSVVGGVEEKTREEKKVEGEGEK